MWKRRVRACLVPCSQLFSPGKREPNRKIVEPEEVKILRFFFSIVFLLLFLFYEPLILLKAATNHAFPSIWFRPTLQNECACAGLSWGFLFFFLQPLFPAQREDVQCLSLRNRTGAAAQGSFFFKKVNKKCSQGGSCHPLGCVRRVYLTGWWNQINWLYYTSVRRGVWVVCRLIQKSGLHVGSWRKKNLKAAVTLMYINSSLFTFQKKKNKNSAALLYKLKFGRFELGLSEMVKHDGGTEKTWNVTWPPFVGIATDFQTQCEVVSFYSQGLLIEGNQQALICLKHVLLFVSPF